MIVINDGVPGENSTELRARFARELAKWRPQYLILYTGMNDAANPRKFTSADRYRINLVAMLDDERLRGVEVILIAIQPTDTRRVLQRHAAEDYGSQLPNRRIELLNRVLEDVSTQRHVPLVRFDKVLQAAGGPDKRLSVDGIHLSAAGYGLLANSVRAALPADLHAGGAILCIGDSLTFGQGVRPLHADLAGSDGRPYPTYPAQLQQKIAMPGSSY